MYTRIVVPLDGSALAEVALPHAEELSRMTGAPLHLVRIVDVVTGRPYGSYLAVEAAGFAEALEVEELEGADYLAALKCAARAGRFHADNRVASRSRQP